MERNAIRGALVALTLTLSVVASAQPVEAPSEKPHTAQKAAPNTNDTKPLPVAIVGGIELKETPAAENGEAAREEREKLDLQAQWASAYAARLQAIFSFIGLIGLGCTVYYARKAWLTSQRQMDGLERPYLFVTRPTNIQRFEGASGTGGIATVLSETRHFEFTLENHGRSPCVIRKIAMEGAVAANLVEAAVKATDRLAGDQANQLVAPNRPVALSRQVMIPISLDERTALRAGAAFIFIVGWIEYEDVLGSRFSRSFVWRDIGGVHGFIEDGGAEHNRDRPLVKPSWWSRTMTERTFTIRP